MGSLHSATMGQLPAPGRVAQLKRHCDRRQVPARQNGLDPGQVCSHKVQEEVGGRGEAREARHWQACLPK